MSGVNLNALAAKATNSAATDYLLPVEAYTSQDWYDLEQHLLFGRAWQFVCLETDLKEVGDYVTFDAGPNPLVVIKGKDEVISAFYNICRHRGARLLEGKGNAERGISCFYHKWHYNMDGSLRGVPQAEKFPCLEKDKLGLKPASCGIWNGMVFVNPLAAPDEDLETWMAGFDEVHGAWHPTQLQRVGRSSIPVKANWKLFIENHIDGYHLLHLHALSIPGLNHDEQQWTPVGRHWSFYEPETDIGTPAEFAGKTMPNLKRIDGIGDDRLGSSVYKIFPNLAMAGGATYYAMLTIEPKGPTETIIHTDTYIAKMDGSVLTKPKMLLSLLKSGKPKPSKPTPSSPEGDFMGEDVYAIEALQAAMKSPAFEVGPLCSEWEEAINYFHKALISFMADGQSNIAEAAE